MAVSVSILPSSFVAVRQALRKESLEGGGDVLRHEARLEFVRDDCARAARREDACEAFGDLALRDDVEHLAGNVDGLGRSEERRVGKEWRGGMGREGG